MSSHPVTPSEGERREQRRAELEQPRTEPEQPRTEREQPRTEPEQPCTEPEQPCTEPEQPRTEPEQRRAEREQPRAEPEQRRAEREQRRVERERAAARAVRLRRARLAAAAAAVAAAAVVTVATIESAGRDGGEQRAPIATVRPAGLSAFAGVPERDGVLGDPAARVTLTEYVDLQCPVCARTAARALPQIVRAYVRTGRVKLAVRTLHFLGPDSTRAAKVAAAAELQGKLWPFLETFYANQGEENAGYATDTFLRAVAATAGLDADAALAQADSAFATARLERADADASRLGIPGTPMFTVTRDGGPVRVLSPEARRASVLAAALDRELTR